MKVSDSEDLAEWEEVYFFPNENLVRFEQIGACIKILQVEEGTLKCCHTSFKRILLTKSTYNVKRPLEYEYNSSGEYIQLVFVLCGALRSKEGAQLLPIEEGQHNILYLTNFSGTFTLIPNNNGIMELFSISLPKPFYLTLISKSNPSTSTFFELIDKKKSCLMHERHLQVTPQMKLLIHEVQSCDKPGALKKLLLQARILELLMLQMEQMQVHHQTEVSPKRNVLEEKSLEEAKNIIEQNFIAPPTIQQLSKMVAMNEFNLKKGFKQQYKTTIFGYANQLKMTKAKLLLLESDHTISEVAYMVGYKNPQHFSSAFKKYFNMLPRELRNK